MNKELSKALIREQTKCHGTLQFEGAVSDSGLVARVLTLMQDSKCGVGLHHISRP